MRGRLLRLGENSVAGKMLLIVFHPLGLHGYHQAGEKAGPPLGGAGAVPAGLPGELRVHFSGAFSAGIQKSCRRKSPAGGGDGDRASVQLGGGQLPDDRHHQRGKHLSRKPGRLRLCAGALYCAHPPDGPFPPTCSEAGKQGYTGRCGLSFCCGCSCCCCWRCSGSTTTA